MTLEQKESIIEQVSSWSDDKIETMSTRMLDHLEYSIRANTPNLFNENEAADFFTLITAFRIQLEENKDYGQVTMMDIEESITLDDKSELAEFAEKLKAKAQAMPVTAIKNEDSQEETLANLLQEDSFQPVSIIRTGSAETGENLSGKSTKRSTSKAVKNEA
jgi:hypothetical protein